MTIFLHLWVSLCVVSYDVTNDHVITVGVASYQIILFCSHML